MKTNELSKVESFQPGDHVALRRVKDSLNAPELTYGVVVLHKGNHSASEPRVRWAKGWGVSCSTTALRKLTESEIDELPDVELFACDK